MPRSKKSKWNKPGRSRSISRTNISRLIQKGRGRAPGTADWLTEENKDNEELATTLQPSFSSLPSVEIFRHASIRRGDWSRHTGVAFSATDSFFTYSFCAAICSRGARCCRERL